MMPERWQVAWLRCPACRGEVARKGAEELCCPTCGSTYKIRDGIPVFFPAAPTEATGSEARFWEEEYPAEADGGFETLDTGDCRKVADFFDFLPHGLGLEFGCGSGAASRFIRDSTIVGLDISQTLLRRASHLVAVQGSGEALPFTDELFDFVLASASLHHMPRLEQAISEIARCLRPGGRFGVLELNCHHPQRKLVAKTASRFRPMFRGTHFSPAETLIPEHMLTSLFAHHGLLIEARRYWSPTYKHPSVLGKLQQVTSRFLAFGPLKKYVESYVLLLARKREL